MTFIEACRAYKAVTGKLPLPITMMIEGEEECGSKNLFGFVRDNADEFKLDLALVCDTSMWDANTPAITTSLRGLVYEEVQAHLRRPRPAFRPVRRRGAKSDAGAEQESSRRCTTSNGRVTIPGFYDGVKELPPDIKADLAGAQPDAEKFLGQVGLKAPAGEKDRMLIEQITTRPTAEINGIDRRLHRRGRQDRAARRRPRPRFPSVWSATRTRPRSATLSAPSCEARLPVDCTVEFANFADAPALQLAFRQSGARQGARRARRPSGARRPSPSAPAARSRSSATSRACSAWTRSWSASRSTTTGCIRRTRSST